jgi:hypothetical protein
MRSPICITNKIALIAVLLLFPAAAGAQRIAVLVPEPNDVVSKFGADLSRRLSARLKVIDGDMAEAAFRSVESSDPFNMTLDEAKRAGSAIGCDFFILLRGGTYRRTSFEDPEYYESFAAVFVVSSRTGRLVMWKLARSHAKKGDAFEPKLAGLAEEYAVAIAERAKTAIKSEAIEPPVLRVEEVPTDGSPLAKDFRAPVPYNRIKPEYTDLAFLFNVRPTVDIRVDLDASGAVLRTEIMRWAGFGLDEAVIAAVNKMSWRPAERGGKTLPIRFLLRYNFTRIEK